MKKYYDYESFDVIIFNFFTIFFAVSTLKSLSQNIFCSVFDFIEKIIEAGCMIVM